MSSLANFVFDSLHDILGFSDKAIAEYILEVIRRKPSVNELLSSFATVGIEKDEKTERFANELIRKIGGKSSTSTSISTTNNQENYKSVLEEANLNEKKRKANYRARDSTNESESSSKRAKLSDDHQEELLDSEERIKRDREEVSQFQSRLRAKDDTATKKKVGNKEDSASIKTHRTDLVDPNMAPEDQVPELREKSRQVYFTKREPQKLEEAEKLLINQKLLFAGERLTEAELKEMEIQENLIKMARERVSLRDVSTEGYHIPEDEFDKEGKIDSKNPAMKMFSMKTTSPSTATTTTTTKFKSRNKRTY